MDPFFARFSTFLGAKKGPPLYIEQIINSEIFNTGGGGFNKIFELFVRGSKGVLAFVEQISPNRRGRKGSEVCFLGEQISVPFGT